MVLFQSAISRRTYCTKEPRLCETRIEAAVSIQRYVAAKRGSGSFDRNSELVTVDPRIYLWKYGNITFLVECKNWTWFTWKKGYSERELKCN